MATYVCLNVKINKYIYVCNFSTKVFDWIKKYVHHGKNQPHQEVEDGYFPVNFFNTYAPPVAELIEMVENTTL